MLPTSGAGGPGQQARVWQSQPGDMALDTYDVLVHDVVSQRHHPPAHCVLAALGSLLALGYAGAGARGGPARAGPPSATR